jgi:hypothetical protein
MFDAQFALESTDDRPRRLCIDVSRCDRYTGRILVQFGRDLPRDRLGRALELERACCPFIGAVYDDAEGQRLALTVEQAAQEPVLDALAEASRPRFEG